MGVAGLSSWFRSRFPNSFIKRPLDIPSGASEPRPITRHIFKDIYVEFNWALHSAGRIVPLRTGHTCDRILETLSATSAIRFNDPALQVANEESGSNRCNDIAQLSTTDYPRDDQNAVIQLAKTAEMHVSYAMKLVLHGLTATRQLYIAMDGAAPLAKMTLQQERRIKKKATLRNSFPVQAVTCGTTYMNAIQKALEKTLLDRHKYFIPSSSYCMWMTRLDRIVLDGSSHWGEGETKVCGRILQNYLKSNKQTSDDVLIISGGDADLLLQVIAIGVPDVYLQSRASSLPKEPFFSYNALLQELQQTFPNPVETRLDLVLICLLAGGNDVMHSVRYVNLNDFWDTYVLLRSQPEYQSQNLVQTESQTLNISMFQKLCQMSVNKRLQAFQNVAIDPVDVIEQYFTTLWRVFHCMLNGHCYTFDVDSVVKAPTLYSLALADPNILQEIFSRALLPKTKIDSLLNEQWPKFWPSIVGMMVLDPLKQGIAYIPEPLRPVYAATMHGTKTLNYLRIAEQQQLLLQLVEPIVQGLHPKARKGITPDKPIMHEKGALGWKEYGLLSWPNVSWRN